MTATHASDAALDPIVDIAAQGGIEYLFPTPIFWHVFKQVDALNAEQIYWAEQEHGERMFRQYVNQGEVNPCIIVDDIIRSGNAIEETVNLVKSLGARIIGCGAIVRFDSALNEVEGVPVKSLIEFDVKMYEGDEDCLECKNGVAPETVRF